MSVITAIKLKKRTSRWSELVRRLEHGDVIFRLLTLAAGMLVILAAIGIGFELWQNSARPRAEFGFDFLVGTNWDPVIEDFGALPFLYGTLQTSLFSLLIAVPIGLGIAIFLTELAPDWLLQPVGFVVELLAAVPSVIFGLWGLFVFVPVVVKPFAQFLNGTLGWLPIFEGPVFGPSRLAATLILSIMVLPTLVAISRDVFLAIPPSQREGALGLGATRWEMITQNLIPYGLSGILGAVILALGRAMGETIAVTMVIGNNLDLSASLLHPGYTMASLIANEFTEATTDMYREALILIGFVLFGLTLLVNIIARLLVWRVARRIPTESRA
ncbi:MAG: phosphate ABC transporter permease subunit PstC [Chloroflexi bacterium]|nr:phosphate ABC transporter permease subunit PstC [Chloroflexota bacterium]